MCLKGGIMNTIQLLTGLKRIIKTAEGEVEFFISESLKKLQEQELKIMHLEKENEKLREVNQLNMSSMIK